MGKRSFITIFGVEHDFKSEWLDLINIDEYDNIYEFIDGVD
ncbi:MAG: hypothetical protein RSD22_05085 [Romboutsia sp.]